ncbi:MAG: TIM barrel protein [Firmicutes bacterium]|jgi:xylose isomerase|nr:TIM barrel protein [Bacillota bacterium]
MAFTDLRYQKERRTPEELLRHLETFELDLKVSVGIWYFTPGGGRFHEAYVDPKSVPERLKMAAEMARYGVKGIEAHYPLEVNEENLHLYKQLEKETGIRLCGAGPHNFWHRAFEFGSLSSTDPTARQRAYDTLVGNLKLNREADVDVCGVWPGIDGYTIPYGHVYYDMWDRFEEALAAAMDEVPGVRVAIEPKPYEPVPNNIYRTSADGLILARDVESRLKHPENRRLLAEGHALVGMQPEIGHIRMGFEDVPYVFCRIARQGRLAHTHWNSQPLGNYDQDLNVGAVEWQQAEAALYALKMIGYRGYFGIDINPERMHVQKAIEINTTVLRIMNDRINALPHDRILECYFNPRTHRGDLELILAESMARR